MKIRNGFVSNSSSSSFIAIIKKEHYEKGLESITPYAKACIEALGHSEAKFLGEDVITLGLWYSPGGSCWEFIDVEYENEDLDEDEEYDQKSESLDNLISEVKKIYGKDSVVTASTHF